MQNIHIAFGTYANSVKKILEKADKIVCKKQEK